MSPVDILCRSQRRIASERARITAPVVPVDVIGIARMRESHLSAAFECMSPCGPCDRVGICIERRTFADVAVEVISHLRTEIRLAAADAYHRDEGNRVGPGRRFHTQLWQDRNSTNVRNECQCILLGGRIGQTVDRVRSGTAHSESSFVEKSRGQCRGEIDGQHLRRAVRDSVESSRPDAGCIVGVRGFVTPACVDFISGAEVVIDFEVELLADIGLPEAEPIRTAPCLLHPAEVRRVQAVAYFVVVRPRHGAQHLFDVSGRIYLAAIGIPG